jgi:hypothetical protein
MLPHSVIIGHVERLIEEQKMFILECVAVLAVIAILITPAPEVE